MNSYFLLMAAIAAEIAGSIALRQSDGLTKLMPTTIVVVGYGAAFYLLSLAVRTIPLSISYSMWAGLGTAGAVLAGVWLFGETVNLWQILGILLIVGGVLMLNFLGSTPAH